MSQPDITTDIAVIGAGAAGTYSAYRLTQDTDKSVAVFEGNTRVGGRLWSHHWTEADTMVELGGEAFSPSHAIVAGLVKKELKLTIAPHKAFNALHRCFLRNKLIKPIDMLNRQSYPQAGKDPDDTKMRYFMEEDYFVKPDGPMPFGDDTIADPFEAVAKHLLKHLDEDVSKSFYNLINGYMGRLAELAGLDEHGQQINDLTADQVAEFMNSDLYNLMGQVIHALEKSTYTCSPLTKSVLGCDRVPTHNLDFWSMVVNDLGQEAYALFRSAGYDNTSALSFNLVELLENLLLGALLGLAGPNFWSIEGGFDQLPKTLMRRAQDIGASLYLGHHLLSVHRDDDAGIIEIQFARPGLDAPVVVHANQVVMSAPVQCFDHGVSLTGFDPGLTQAFSHRRGGITSIPAGKLYLVYPNPWWTQMTDLDPGADPLYGYASTDMPPRAVYYKGKIGDGDRALMTGALTDSVSADFWTGFLSPDAQIFPGASEEERRDFSAPVHMVSAAQGMLKRMHRDALGDATIPAPEMALYHEWRQHGGGWSAWKSGRDIHKDAAFMRLPFRAGSIDEGLYCCGDSVAERHGWVENTLESAEAMLQEAFDLKPARWLPSGDLF